MTDLLYVVNGREDTKMMTTDPEEAAEWTDRWYVHTFELVGRVEFEHKWNASSTESYLNGEEEA